MKKHILMVVTSADKMSNGKQTGLWLSEFVEPYNEFMKKGYRVTVASPLGGHTPIDANSLSGDDEDVSKLSQVLANTVKLEDASANAFDGIFLPGGHGTMFDLPENKTLQKLIRDFYESKKVVGAVCHGPAGLVGVTLSDGNPLVRGKHLTAFTDSEEQEAGLDKDVPFLLERKFRELGAVFITGANWSDHVEVDGNLVTGQNPQSGTGAALAFINVLEA